MLQYCLTVLPLYCMLMKTSVYEKYASVNIIWHYVNSLHNTLELDNVSWQLPGRELSVVSPHHNSKVCNYYVELNDNLRRSSKLSRFTLTSGYNQAKLNQVFWNLAEKSGEFLFLARAQAKLDNIDGKMSFSINRFD